MAVDLLLFRDLCEFTELCHLDVLDVLLFGGGFKIAILRNLRKQGDLGRETYPKKHMGKYRILVVTVRTRWWFQFFFNLHP